MKHEHPNPEAHDSPPKTKIEAVPPLQLDPEEYRDYLAAFDLTETQQNELLETLLHILRTFVEIGFGLDPVQNIFSGIVEKALQEESGALDKKKHFNRIAAPEGDNNERSPS
ncbi:MAG: hypothetical protein AB2809_21275 [Candidatus Thiodiazotropha sp.]